MLTTILKAVGVLLGAMGLLLVYSLVKAASMAEEFEQFDEWYENQDEQ